MRLLKARQRRGKRARTKVNTVVVGLHELVLSQ